MVRSLADRTLQLRGQLRPRHRGVRDPPGVTDPAGPRGAALARRLRGGGPWLALQIWSSSNSKFRKVNFKYPT